MQLEPPRPPTTPAQDLASALRSAAAALGQRPAVTVLSQRGREEQGVASLAQWAAKGAHLLELELLLGPGDRLLLDAPPSWPTAAVCLAAWWAGIEVVLPDVDGDVAAAVVHESRTAPDGVTDTLWVGDAIDGGPLDPVPGREPWSSAVQTFPDQPPTPRAAGHLPALAGGGRVLTQAEVLAAAAALGEGVLGIEADRVTPLAATIAVAARPIVALRPTVVLRGVDRSAADGDRVTTWL